MDKKTRIVMHCTNCGEQISKVDQFCSKCGNPVRSNHQTRNQRSQHKNYIPALQTEDGKKQYDSILQDYATYEKNVKRCVWIVAILSILVCLLPIPNEHAFGAFIVAAICTIFNLSWSVGLMNQDEYYTIPGSHDAHGHRCISCGHKGIYKKGAYKSDIVKAQCSKCSFEFWKESK